MPVQDQALTTLMARQRGSANRIMASSYVVGDGGSYEIA